MRDIESGLDWCRNKGVMSSGVDEDSPAFNKIGSLPVSRRSPEDRQKDVDNAMTWLRNGKNDSDDPTDEFKKID